MSLEKTINKMLQDYLNSKDGQQAMKEAISEEIRSGNKAKVVGPAVEEAIKLLKECICNFAPPAFSSSETEFPISAMIDGIVSDPVATSDGWEVGISFDGEKIKRPSLWKGSEGAYNILGLFSQGWDIPDDKKSPSGMWHGKKTVALRHRDGTAFIEDAVSFFMATYADKYNVIGIDVDPLYGNWGM